MNKKIITYAIIVLTILETICVLALGVLTIKYDNDTKKKIEIYANDGNIHSHFPIRIEVIRPNSTIWTIYLIMVSTVISNIFLIITLLKIKNRITRKIAIVMSMLCIIFTFCIPTSKNIDFSQKKYKNEYDNTTYKNIYNMTIHKVQFDYN